MRRAFLVHMHGPCMHHQKKAGGCIGSPRLREEMEGGMDGRDGKDGRGEGGNHYSCVSQKLTGLLPHTCAHATVILF